MACRAALPIRDTCGGWGVVAASRLIPVRVGDVEIEMEAVQPAGTEAISGRAAKATGNVLEAFGRAQEAIIEVAKSADMIDKAGAAARPDRGYVVRRQGGQQE
jgi:hypothetical protein